MGSMSKSFVQKVEEGVAEQEQWDHEERVYCALLKSEIERHVAELARTHAVSLADVHFNVTDGKVTVIHPRHARVRKEA